MEQQFEQLPTALNSELTGSSELAPQGSSALSETDDELTTPIGQRVYPPDAQIRDVDDILWNIRETRPTRHGFDILLGYPAKPLLRRQRGPVGKFRLIVTRELVAYWEDHYADEAAIYDIPVSRRTVNLVSRRVCFNIALERRRSIRRRRTTPPEPPSIREFARRYQVSLEDAEEWHMFLLDPTPRPHQWWRDPAPLAVLLSAATLAEMSLTLGISSTYASRLRKRAVALENSRTSRASRTLSRIRK
jgi:hypothetical protein